MAQFKIYSQAGADARFATKEELAQIPEPEPLPERLSEATLNATFGTPAYNLMAAGLGGGTLDIRTLLDAAVAAGAKRIVVPYRSTPWPMLTTWTASDVWLDFEPGARISFNMDTVAMDLTRVKLTNAHFTSPYTRGTAANPLQASDNSSTGNYVSFARVVRLRDGCVIEGYYHEHAAGGLDIAGANVRLRDLSFFNLRHYKGWAAAIHTAGGGAYDVRGSGIKIVGCDRGVETEAGARDVSMVAGHQKDVYPNGYTGQPGDYATYSFILDAHSHLGESACVNIVYRDWLLENCGGAVTFIRSNGTNGSDHPRNCLAENIRILGRAMSTGYETIAVQGYNNVVRGVQLMQGAGITSLMRLRVWGGSSENNRFEDIRAEAYALPLVTVDNDATGTVLGNFRPTLPIMGSGFVFDIAGRYTRIDQASVFAVTGTGGYIRFQATADYSKISAFNYNVATGETFSEIVLIDGADNVQVSGINGSNYATTPPVDIRVGGAARYASVQGNNIDRAAGVSISIAATASRNVVMGNVLSTGTATIENLGPENTVKDNLRGNAFA